MEQKWHPKSGMDIDSIWSTGAGTESDGRFATDCIYESTYQISSCLSRRSNSLSPVVVESKFGASAFFFLLHPTRRTDLDGRISQEEERAYIIHAPLRLISRRSFSCLFHPPRPLCFSVSRQQCNNNRTSTCLHLSRPAILLTSFSLSLSSPFVVFILFPAGSFFTNPTRLPSGGDWRLFYPYKTFS